jgi:predicted DNA-binding protein
MTRPKEFKEQLSFLVMEGTKARLDAVCGDSTKADVLREAIERELRRLERKR